MDKVCYYDQEIGGMVTRDCTPEEQAEIDAIRSALPSIAESNAPILAALEAIDARTPRAVREALISGDNTRVEALEAEASELRQQLRKG